MAHYFFLSPTTFEEIIMFMIDVIGGEFERGNIVKEDRVSDSAATDEI